MLNALANLFGAFCARISLHAEKPSHSRSPTCHSEDMDYPFQRPTSGFANEKENRSDYVDVKSGSVVVAHAMYVLCMGLSSACIWRFAAGGLQNHTSIHPTATTTANSMHEETTHHKNSIKAAPATAQGKEEKRASREAAKRSINKRCKMIG